MAKNRFQTPWTSMDDKSPVAESNSVKSETVPDQSLTVRQILDKFASGTIGDIGHNDLDYSEDLPDLRGLDITELEAMKADAQMDIDEINAMIAFQEQSTGNHEESPTPVKKKGKVNPSPSDTSTPENTDE
ncbi:hypothetical protein [Elizabethkingia bruuniana]|uniref:hypothetical protein n=1 Tax=Elizabethkingia bruuniana TaxID=1756149 RepID=UPI0009991648|nr:hypothetical protein [Elizabethkingia bruuniana]OPC58832.1 hypothetical protein BAY07_00750 [Elizabethkingia bruuniana]